MSSFTEWLRSVGLAGYALGQPYGANAGKLGYGSSGHGGQDVPVPAGTPLRIPAGVTKITAGQEMKDGKLAGWGNYLRMYFADGSWAQFAHLDGFLNIKPGQTITNPLPGSIYAKSGNTGNSTGPHVDIERRDANGNRVNPATASYPGAQVFSTVWEKLKSLGVDFGGWNATEKKSFETEYDPATGRFKALPAGYERLKPDVLKAFTGIDTTQPDWEGTPAAQSYAAQGWAGWAQDFLSKAGVNIAGVVLALALFIGGVLLLGASF